jgi:hypothetical protein
MTEKKSVTTENTYTYYKNHVEKKKRVKKKEYVALNFLYNKFVMNKIIAGDTVTLPCKLGTLGILGKKPVIDPNSLYKKLAPNWRLTKELWEKNPEARKIKKLIYNTNEHSGGIRYRFTWCKNAVPIPNKAFYSLLISRTNKRTVWKKVMGGGEYLLLEKNPK